MGTVIQFVGTVSRVRNKYSMGGHHISLIQYAPHQSSFYYACAVRCYIVSCISLHCMVCIVNIISMRYLFVCCLCGVMLCFPFCSFCSFSCCSLYWLRVRDLFLRPFVLCCRGLWVRGLWVVSGCLIICSSNQPNIFIFIKSYLNKLFNHPVRCGYL